MPGNSHNDNLHNGLNSRRLCQLPNNNFGLYYVENDEVYFYNVILDRKHKLEGQKGSVFATRVKWIGGEFENYTFSNTPFMHPVFQNICLSAYPLDTSASQAVIQNNMEISFDISSLPIPTKKNSQLTFKFKDRESAAQMVISINAFCKAAFQDQPHSKMDIAIDKSGLSFTVKEDKWQQICDRRSNRGLLPHEIMKDITQKRELDVKYARPTLDLEFIQNVGPCVRCYLTLTDRPRPNKQDKDIVQDKDGVIKLINVNLMNFGTPLRALTWVEDYYKNPEHGNTKFMPLIRTFLIPLDNYLEILALTTSVDKDRATGQVRMVSEVTPYFRPVNNSLVTFSDHKDEGHDGIMKKFEDLSEFVFGEQIHPIDFSDKSTNSHQHNRTVKSTVSEYIHCAIFKPNSMVKPMIEAQCIEASYREVRQTDMSNQPSKFK